MVVVQAQLGSVTFAQGHFWSYTVTRIFSDNLSQKLDRVVRMVLLCTAGQDASIAKYTDLRSPLNIKAT